MRISLLAWTRLDGEVGLSIRIIISAGKDEILGLDFQMKIGTGMGEQMLSREYYYLGTQLPIDRFLTFYYGHSGFHINNILVIYSIQVFMVTC